MCWRNRSLWVSLCLPKVTAKSQLPSNSGAWAGVVNVWHVGTWQYLSNQLYPSRVNHSKCFPHESASLPREWSSPLHPRLPRPVSQKPTVKVPRRLVMSTARPAAGSGRRACLCRQQGQVSPLTPEESGDDVTHSKEALPCLCNSEGCVLEVGLSLKDGKGKRTTLLMREGRTDRADGAAASSRKGLGALHASRRAGGSARNTSCKYDAIHVQELRHNTSLNVLLRPGVEWKNLFHLLSASFKTLLDVT